MSIGSRIKERRESLGLTQVQLAELLGVTKGAIGNYETDANSPKASMLYKVFDVLQCDANYLFQDEIRERREHIASPWEMEHLVKKYRLLDHYGKEAVDGVLDVEWRRTEQAKAQEERSQRPKPTVTLRRPLTQVAAAEGAGAFLLDSDYDKVTVELNEYTQKADIILKVVGRSMEPAIHDGDHILVREQPSVEMGKIGVFIIDGNGFLKQAAPDRLISLNPNVPDVMIADQQTAECYGKFICVLDPEWVVEK